MKVYAFNSIESAADAVLYATCQATLLSLAVLGILFCLGSRIRASWRFALWLVVFVRFAMPWAPAASWSLYSFLPMWDRNEIAAETELPTSTKDPVALRDVSRLIDEVEFHQSRPTATPDSIVAVDAPPSNGQLPATSNFSSAKPWSSPAQWLSLVWCAGATALLMRLILLHAYLARRHTSWKPIDGSRAASVFAQCLAEMRIHRPVRVLLSGDQTGPATYGILKTTIVLPAAMAETLTHQELRLIFLHELFHMRRFDTLTDLFASVVTAVHWFNPCAWFALAAIRRERELACDAATLEKLGSDARKVYGEVLLRAVESLQLTAAPAGTVAMFERQPFVHSLENRIQSVMSHRPATKLAHFVGALLLTLTVGIGLTDVVAKDPGNPVAAQQGAGVAQGRQPSSKTFVISGVCTDEAAHPLADVRVRLYRTDWVRTGRIEPVQEMRTNDSGRYRFMNVEAPSIEEEIHSNYLCILDAPGRATQSIYVHRVDQEQVQSVRMAPAVKVTGRVTDTDGKPIAGAWVWTQGIAGEPFDGVMSAKTDADGQYVIHDLEGFDADTAQEIEFGDGETTESLQWVSIVIRARDADHVQIRSSYTRTPGSVDFVLPTGGSLEGQVIDAASRKPAANVLVTLRPALSNRSDSDLPSEENFRQGKTDSQGHYRFTGLGATEYTITARSADRACKAVESDTVETNKILQAADLELISGAVIEGKVIDEDGRPVVRHPKFGTRLSVHLRGPSTSTRGEYSELYSVDDNGRFRIRVAPGRNQLSMQQGSTGRPIENPEQNFQIAAGETQQVVFRILKQAPPEKRDIPIDDLPMPVLAEQPAANAIRELGGWYKLDKDSHVAEVNMVFYVTQKGRRYDNDQLSSQSLSYLGQFPHLKSLYLTDSQATDDGFQLVGQLPQLETMIVWNAKLISDVGIQHLTNLKTLKSLHLWDCGVTDQAINDLAKIASIESLGISSGFLTDEAFQHAARLPRLQWLDIRGKAPLTDRAAQSVARMPALQNLTLVGNITNDGLREMHRVKTLKSLDLYSDKITADGVLELQKAIPDLKVSALEKRFPSYHAVQEAADPKRQQVNREEGMQGLQQIRRFLKLMSQGESAQAATFCRSFTCQDPEPSSPEAALEPPEYRAGPAVVKHIQREIKSFADCDISMAYGDTEEVIAITTVPRPEIMFRKGSDGRLQQVTKPVVLRAVKSHGKWYVDSDNIAGSDDPQWRINYFLGDHAGAQKLSP